MRRVVLTACLLAGLAPLPAMGATTKLTPAQMREDLIHLRDTWAPTDRSFDPAERKSFETIVADAIARVHDFSCTDFSLTIAKAVAAARNGHTQAALAPCFNGLPLRASWFADGLYIVQTHPEFTALLGARIERFGRLTTEQALARVSPFISGTDTRIRDLSPAFLRLLEVLKTMGATQSDKQAALTLRLRNGETQTLTLKAAPSPAPDGASSWRTLIPSEQAGRWPHVLDALPARPLAYQAPENFSRHWLGKQQPVLYIRSNKIFGTVQNRYALFERLLAMLQFEVVPYQPKYIIVDLRFNSGGDFLNTITFAQAVPKLIPPDGKIFVLVGPSTFSAALVTAAMLKGHGGGRTVLIGESMGDSHRFWSEGQPSTLPNSGIQVTPATLMHDWTNGCNDFDRCYWANVAFGLTGVSIEPDVRIATEFQEYADGRDPVLERALSMAKQE